MATDCEHCAYYAFDEEWGDYVCDIGGALDEDDEARLRERGSGQNCPFFRYYDEYTLVRKQN